jgi:hypothetical protein
VLALYRYGTGTIVDLSMYSTIIVCVCTTVYSCCTAVDIYSCS